MNKTNDTKKCVCLTAMALLFGLGAAGAVLGEPATRPAGGTKTQSQTSAATRPAQQEKKPMAKQYSAPPPMTIDPKKTYTATIETTAGTIKVELDPKNAPQHVNSFVFLSREGFYNGAIFYRVIPGFMIQGGDPSNTGIGGSGYTLKAEFNETHHGPGILSAPRQTNDINSASSQFFIMHGDGPHLDHLYTAYGHVTSGMDVEV